MSGFPNQGVVYFAACDRFVKIGYSSGDIGARMRHMFSSSLIVPADLDRRKPLEVLRTIPGCLIRDERRIHGLFAAHHEAGEWYRMSLPFLRQMQSLDYVTEKEIRLRFRRARADLKKSRLRASLSDTG